MLPAKKPKLPKFLSFPLGFEIISSALLTVPIADEIGLSFHEHYGNSQMDFQKIVESGSPYVIVSAEFDKWERNVFRNSRFYQGLWHLNIYPVRREFKSIARTALLNDGLPRISEWFTLPRVESWYFGRKRRHIIFSSGDGQIRVEDVELDPA